MVSSNYLVRKRAKVHLIIKFPHKNMPFLVKMKHSCIRKISV